MKRNSSPSSSPKNITSIDGKKYFVDRNDLGKITFYEIEKNIINRQSRYQHIQVFHTKLFGKALILDGGTQISEGDHYIYTESLVWPALFMHPNPKSILILGGGDGDALREVLRNPHVQRTVLVDIDKDVIDITQKSMPMLWGNALKDPRAHVITQLADGHPADARAFLKERTESFDIIISDLTDPNESGMTTPLIEKGFFRLIRSHLNKNGIFAMQAGKLTENEWRGHRLVRNLIQTVFGPCLSYRVFVPWFNGMWSFVVATNTTRLAKIKKERVSARLLVKYASKIGGFSYLTPATFGGLFGIEPALEKKISGTLISRRQKRI